MFLNRGFYSLWVASGHQVWGILMGDVLLSTPTKTDVYCSFAYTYNTSRISGPGTGKVMVSDYNAEMHVCQGLIPRITFGQAELLLDGVASSADISALHP